MIDGRPLADWDEAALRGRIALIGQKPQLMAGTIAQNIRLGCPQASDERCARPQGARESWNSPSASRWAWIPCWADAGRACPAARRSAWLARLFLRDPGLILLDEPTAHLDEDTQARVLDEILTFAAGGRCSSPRTRRRWPPVSAHAAAGGRQTGTSMMRIAIAIAIAASGGSAGSGAAHP